MQSEEIVGRLCRFIADRKRYGIVRAIYATEGIVGLVLEELDVDANITNVMQSGIRLNDLQFWYPPSHVRGRAYQQQVMDWKAADLQAEVKKCKKST